MREVVTLIAQAGDFRPQKDGSLRLTIPGRIDSTPDLVEVQFSQEVLEKMLELSKGKL